MINSLAEGLFQMANSQRRKSDPAGHLRTVSEVARDERENNSAQREFMEALAQSGVSTYFLSDLVKPLPNKELDSRSLEKQLENLVNKANKELVTIIDFSELDSKTRFAYSNKIAQKLLLLAKKSRLLIVTALPESFQKAASRIGLGDIREYRSFSSLAELQTEIGTQLAFSNVDRLTL